MAHVIVGLGNPGEEYKDTRHNAGRTLVECFARAHNFGEWEEKKKPASCVLQGKLGKEKAVLVLPNTFMNKSGSAVTPFVKSKKAVERLVVVYDDIDLPLGTVKISFGRGSGGHKGLESIIRAAKTKDFVRVRVGVANTTPGGKIKKPNGEKKVVDFLMQTFRKPEHSVVKKVSKQVCEALEMIVKEGRAVAMNMFNRA